MAPAIAVRNLTRTFGDLTAVDNVTLDVPEGSIYGLIGHNGAGKSTTLAMLAALLAPTSGSIEIAGIDPTAKPKEACQRIGYMPDVLGFYDRLTVEEYLDFYARAYRIAPSIRSATVTTTIELVDLAAQRDAEVDSLSRGMKQRLSLGRALINDPSVLLLDEPASGLDPRARVELRELLLGLQQMGKTILISSHILAELEELCSDVAIMHKGRLVASGPMDAVAGRIGRTRRVRVRFAVPADESLEDPTAGSNDDSGPFMADAWAEEEFDVADDRAQQTLLQSLIVAGRPVLEFTGVRTGLESLYLELTADPTTVNPGMGGGPGPEGVRHERERAAP